MGVFSLGIDEDDTKNIEFFDRVKEQIGKLCKLPAVIGEANRIGDFNPIAYGGGGFLSHTTTVLAVTLKPLKTMAPKLCNFLFLPFFHNLRKILAKLISQGVATVIFKRELMKN